MKVSFFGVESVHLIQFGGCVKSWIFNHIQYILRREEQPLLGLKI